MAVDRFGAVTLPLHSLLISSKLCPFFIFATWIAAIAFHSPELLALKLTCWLSRKSAPGWGRRKRANAPPPRSSPSNTSAFIFINQWIKGFFFCVRTCEIFLCFVTIVRVMVYYVDFFVYFVLRQWGVSRTPRQSRIKRSTVQYFNATVLKTSRTTVRVSWFWLYKIVLWIKNQKV